MIQSGVGASASEDRQPTVECDALVTTYFDPDEEYKAKCFAAQGIVDYLDGSDYKEDVFLITGLKVAKNLRYSSTSSTQREARGELAGKEPNSGVGLGATGGRKSNYGHNVNFESKDLVVGFRCRRYAYIKASRNPMSKKKKPHDDVYLKGAQMHGDDGEDPLDDVALNEIPMPEEEKAHKEAAESGNLVDEIWVEHSQQ